MKDIFISACSKNGGIYRYSLTDSGKLIQKDKLSIEMPMYQIMRNDKMYVLIKEAFENNHSGLICVNIDKNTMSDVSEIKSTQGLVGCHLDECEGDIYCVNYTSGSVIKMSDKLVCHEGSGVNLPRQAGPHTHYVCVTPDKKYVLVTDLGLDTIFVYDRELNVVDKIKTSEGYGVRHLVFSDDKKYLFAVTELKASVCVFSYNDGKLKLIDTISILPDDFCEKNLAAAIRIHNGFIYASNRGHDTIVKLSFDGKKLKIENTFDCGGKEPRDFDFAGDFLISCNMASDNVKVFKEENGKLIMTDSVDIEQPLCVTSMEFYNEQ